MKFPIQIKTALFVLVHSILLLLVCGSNAYADSISYSYVKVDTSSLVGNPSGPFSLYFQFNDGGILGNNSATIYNFDFFGGSAAGSPSDSTFGDIGSTVSFNNRSAFQELFQEFVPGPFLGFNVALSSSLTDAAGTPDAFSFGILDRDLFNIPTNGLGDALLLANISSTPPAWQVFSGTGAFANVAVSVAPVPEPGTWALTLTGLGLMSLVAHRRRKAAQAESI